jgi:hypothetical protein
VGRNNDLRKTEIVRLLKHKKSVEISFERAYKKLKDDVCTDNKKLIDHAMGCIIEVTRELIELGHDFT